MTDGTPNVLYWGYPDGMHARGRESLLLNTEPTVGPRVNPTRGTYLSNSNVYTGLLPGWTPDMLTPVIPGSSGYTVITNAGPYNNMLFWGGLKLQSPVEPVFNNCAVAGPKPTVQSTDGIIRGYGAGYYQATMNDSLIDPELWMDQSLAGYSTWSVPAGYRYPGNKLEYFRQYNRSAGLHGGNMTMRRVEIRHTVDCVNSVQNNTSPGLFTLLEDCWLHSNHYYRDPAFVTQTGGWHSDGFQFSVGINITIRGGFIGGVRGDYGLDSNTIPQDQLTELHYNPGHDPKGACIMLKQEPVINSPLLGNILIEDVVFQGGDYCVNHFYSTTTPNPMTTVVLRRLKFVKIPTPANGQGGYIVRSANYASCYDVPTMRLITLNGSGGWTDVGPAPITNG